MPHSSFQAIDEDRLFDWHAAMSPTGRCGMNRITVGSVLFKAQLWDTINQKPVNISQRLIVNRMLEDDFEGFMNTSKYAKLAKCSNDKVLTRYSEIEAKTHLHPKSRWWRSTSYRLPNRDDLPRFQ